MADSKISDLAEATALADTDELLIAASGASKKVSAIHVRTWDQILDIPGDSFSQFTADSGSWSSDGSTININTGTSQARCRVTAPQPQGFGCIIEVEFFATSLTGTAIRVGPLWEWDGSGSNALTFQAYSSDTSPESGGLLRWEIDSVSARLNVNQNWNADTWTKLRAVWSGEACDGYFNGAYAGTSMSMASGVTGTSAHGGYVGLGVQGGTFKFRNFKLWVPTIPV